MKITLLLAAMLFLAAKLFAQTETKSVYVTKAGAIKGYDPVAYFTQNKPVKGAADIVFEWSGATWHFASAKKARCKLYPNGFYWRENAS